MKHISFKALDGQVVIAPAGLTSLVVYPAKERREFSGSAPGNIIVESAEPESFVIHVSGVGAFKVPEDTWNRVNEELPHE